MKTVHNVFKLSSNFVLWIVSFHFYNQLASFPGSNHSRPPEINRCTNLQREERVGGACGRSITIGSMLEHACSFDMTCPPVDSSHIQSHFKHHYFLQLSTNSKVKTLGTYVPPKSQLKSATNQQKPLQQTPQQVSTAGTFVPPETNSAKGE